MKNFRGETKGRKDDSVKIMLREMHVIRVCVGSGKRKNTANTQKHAPINNCNILIRKFRIQVLCSPEIYKQQKYTKIYISCI